MTAPHAPARRRGGRTRAAALVMSALLLLYLVFAIWYAIVLLRVGVPVATGLGVALLVLPLVGIWALVRELTFAVRAERVAGLLEKEGGIPDESLPLMPSGRVSREEADAVFPRYREAVERAPDDWAAWFRLALAYDAAGDRRRARWATRRSITLEREARRAGAA